MLVRLILILFICANCQMNLVHAGPSLLQPGQMENMYTAGISPLQPMCWFFSLWIFPFLSVIYIYRFRHRAETSGEIAGSDVRESVLRCLRQQPMPRPTTFVIHVVGCLEGLRSMRRMDRSKSRQLITRYLRQRFQQTSFSLCNTLGCLALYACQVRATTSTREEYDVNRRKTRALDSAVWSSGRSVTYQT